MTAALLLIAFAAYFIESIFGFGGTILLIAAAGMFYDVSHLILLALLASASASATILLQSWRQVDGRLLLRMLLLSAPGLVVGTLLIGHLPDAALLQVFALILILFGLLGLCRPVWKLPPAASLAMMLVGGVAQGLFATGGPLILIAMRDYFAEKKILRATMAGFFLSSNLWRLLQLSLQDATIPLQMVPYLWVIAPVMIGILLGYQLHLRLSDRVFRHGLNGLFIVAGIAYLLR